MKAKDYINKKLDNIGKIIAKNTRIDENNKYSVLLDETSYEKLWNEINYLKNDLNLIFAVKESD